MEMGENKRQRVLKCLVAVASAMYCLSLVWVLWLKFADAEQLLNNFKNINLIPEEIVRIGPGAQGLDVVVALQHQKIHAAQSVVGLVARLLP